MSVYRSTIMGYCSWPWEIQDRFGEENTTVSGHLAFCCAPPNPSAVWEAVRGMRNSIFISDVRPTYALIFHWGSASVSGLKMTHYARGGGWRVPELIASMDSRLIWPLFMDR
ncbi:hypothetical protein BDR07DRAFT_1485990 [Suillus spraguei]|nr:hypothetical protein BDR07DRAFT_1485990 [Suillus spraguei]